MATSFATRILAIREKKQMTQDEFADFCGLSRSAIARYELGTSKPNRIALEKMAAALNCSMTELLGEDVATRPATDEEIRFALFGGDAKEISDAQYQEVLRFAQYIKTRDKK